MCIRDSGGSLRDALREVVPLRLLLRAEVRPVEQLLAAEDADLLLGRLLDALDVLLHHRLFDGFEAGFRALHVLGLAQAAAHDPRHGELPSRNEGDHYATRTAKRTGTETETGSALP